MKLDAILTNPLSAWRYMERWVNDGSPSGFTKTNGPPSEFHPVFGHESFKISALSSREELSLGYWPNKEIPEGAWAHPILTKKQTQTILNVTPTASGRTVWPLNSFYHIKLSYPLILGRVKRKIPFRVAAAGYENSIYIAQIAKKCQKPFQVLPEIAVRGTVIDGEEHCCILREIKNITQGYVIPIFSLLSIDKNIPNEKTLLNQILHHSNYSERDNFLKNEILIPLIDIFSFFLEKGILPEFNGQNVLVSFNKNWTVKEFIIRDLSRSERFHPNFPSDLLKHSRKVKVLNRNSQAEYCAIRTSLAFDFKLSQYILKPIAQYAQHPEKLKKEIAKYAQSILTLSYFPKNRKWHTLKPVLLTNGEVPLLTHENPQWR